MSWVERVVNRMPAMCILLVCLLLSVACSVDKPVAPRFETDLYLPLGTRTTTGLDLLNGTDYLEGDSTGNGPLEFVFSGQVARFEVGTLLDIDLPHESAFAFSLPSISLSSPATLSTGFPLRSLAPAFGHMPREEQTVVIAPFVIAPVRNPLPPPEGITWARLTSGHLRLLVHNALPVALQSLDGSGEALGLRLLDTARGVVITETAVPGEIPPGGTASLDLDLGGREISGDLACEVYGSSTGSQGTPVPIQVDDQSISVEAEFSQLVADSAWAQVPEQTAVVRDSVRIAEDVFIQGGEVRDGRIALEVRNPFPLSATATVVLPTIVNPSTPWLVYQQVIDLPAGSDGRPGLTTVTLDLSGWMIHSPAAALGSLPYTVSVITPPSDGPIHLGVHETATGSFTGGRLSFDEVTGRLDRRRMAVPAAETQIDPPEGIDDLRFQEASLELDVHSTMPVAGDADLILTATPQDGSTPITLPIQGHIEPGDGSGQPRTTRIVIDQTNSSILDVIAARPRLLRFTGELVVSSTQVATIRRTDWADGEWTVRAPLRVKVGAINHRADPFRFTISRDDQKRIRENLVSGSAAGTVRNGFPVGLTAHLLFAGNEEDLALDPATHPDRVLALDPVEVDPGETDPGTGRVLRSRETPIALSLSPEQIPFFARDALYGQIALTVRGEDANRVVEVTAIDSVEVRALLHFRVRVKQ